MTEPHAPYHAGPEREPWVCRKCGHPLGSVLDDTLTIVADEPAGLTVEVGQNDEAKVTCPGCGGARQWRTHQLSVTERKELEQWRSGIRHKSTVDTTAMAFGYSDMDEFLDDFTP